MERSSESSPGEPFSVDFEGLMHYQANRPPMLLIDHVDAVVPGAWAEGYKDTKEDDWFFKDHFPGDPVMQGCLQTEALAQMFLMTFLTLPGHAGMHAFALAYHEVKFARRIVPGVRFRIRAELESFKRGVATGTSVGTIDGCLACRARLTVGVPDIIEQFRPRAVQP